MLRKQALNNLSFTVPKNRKPKFELKLSIVDLTNIPLVVGHTCVKWHLPSSSSAEHRGKTDKARISEHRATWDYNKTLTAKLTIDKNQSLQPCDIYFEILQEYDHGRAGRVHLGNVKLNLAEFTNVNESSRDDPNAEGEDGMITRRYLMQESKVNATLKVGIAMKQIDGDTNFIAPPLRSAMVVGGIAGIINAEVGGDTDDMPSIASKSRELSEAQDIYRRTLAASWACERGELPPDKLIEDLFSGGDGGKMNAPPILKRMGLDLGPQTRDNSSNSSDADSRRQNMREDLTPDMVRPGHQRGDSRDAPFSPQTPIGTGVSGRASIEQQMQRSHHGSHSHHHHRRKPTDYRGISEFDLRDDLKSWQVQAY